MMGKRVCVLLCVTLVGLALAAEQKGGKAAKSAAPTEEKSAPAEDPKPSPTTASTPTSTPSEGVGGDMEVLDYIRSGALLLAFAVACFAGRDKWMIANTIIRGACGAAMYFFPKPLLDYQTDGSLDALHVYLIQQTGAIFIGMAVATHYSRLSRNSATETTLLLTRALGGVMLLQCACMDYMKAAGDKQKLNTNYLTFGVLGGVLWTAGNTLYAFRSGSFGGGAVTLRNRISVHMFIDVFFLMMFGLMNFGYPDNSLDYVRGFKLDGIHAHLIRAVGVLMVMGALHGLCSLSFTDDKDKRIYLLSRLTISIFSLPVFLLYQWKYAFVTTNYFYVMILLTFIFNTNLLLGYFHPVSLPKFIKRA